MPLGVNPLQHLLAATHVLPTLPAAAQRTITGRQHFPELISGPFHHGLVVVFAVATALAAFTALASLLRGTGQVERTADPQPSATAVRYSSATAPPNRAE